MSDRSVLDHILGGNARSGQQGPDEAAASSDGFVPMLDICLAHGNRFAMPYAMLFKVEFDPSTGITLHYSTDRVYVAGYRLEPLYRAIARHTLGVLRAQGEQAELARSGDAPVVTMIRCDSAEE